MKRILSGLTFVIALVLLVPSTASAQLVSTFNVDSTADEPDDIPGDGDCHTSAGECTLRAAIQEANLLGGAFVNLGADTYTLTIPGDGEDDAATGDLDIRVSTAPNEMIITGAGADKTIIQACDDSGGPCSGIDRVFHIDPALSGVIVEIRDLTIRKGKAPSGLPIGRAGQDGGGLLIEEGDVTLIGVEVKDNSSGHGGSAGGLQGGPAGNGGGIAVHGGSLALTQSTISGNKTGTGGSGTPSGNGGYGGGIAISGGSATIENGTVSGNLTGDGTYAGSGGGLWVDLAALNLNNVTLTDNATGVSSASPDPIPGGGIYAHLADVKLKNVLLAGNGGDCFGTFVSEGFNLIGSGLSCDGFADGTNGDQIGGDPLLGPLQDNGGPTRTHALQKESPAIDGGNPATCLNTDQRGQGRYGDCDIGAFEFAGSCGDGFLQTSAGEECDDSNSAPGDGCDASCLTEEAQGGTTGGTTGNPSGGTTGDATEDGTTGGDEPAAKEGAGGCGLIRESTGPSTTVPDFHGFLLSCSESRLRVRPCK